MIGVAGFLFCTLMLATVLITFADLIAHADETPATEEFLAVLHDARNYTLADTLAEARQLDHSLRESSIELRLDATNFQEGVARAKAAAYELERASRAAYYADDEPGYEDRWGRL